MTLIRLVFFRPSFLRTVGVALLASGLLAGCGFALRNSPNPTGPVCSMSRA
jgi:outer membrane lipopolysaccharide assembly protein LptE/RlpB